MLALSPFALRLLKASFNADEDGLAGIQQLAHDTNLLFYALRGGAGGPRGLQGQAHAGLRAVPQAAVSAALPSGQLLRIWLMAARPRTLPAAVAPVLVGTALAADDDEFHALAFVAALLGAILIQVGTNLSNDYSDARRGADTEDRLGPVRVTAGGLVPPRQVLVATYVTFGAGRARRRSTSSPSPGSELLLVGAASILAGVLYTGGPRPYGYEGLGEVFVFPFFGVVAVTGSYYVQTEELPWEAFVLARAGRPAGRGDPRRQQRARPRDRPARRASGRSRCGSGARARTRRCTRRWSAARSYRAAAVAAGRRRCRRGCCCRC